MKNYLIIAITSLFIITISGCKDNADQFSENEYVINSQLKEAPEPPEGKLIIKCTGEGCTEGGACKATFTDIYHWECCEGCYLEIEYLMDGWEVPVNNGIADFGDVSIYNDVLADYLEDEYSNEDIKVDSMLYESDGNAYYVIYYYTTSSGFESALIYQPPGGGTTIVDCRGSCDDPGEKCTEKAIIKPDGTVETECGCEADGCKMYITQ